MNKTAVVQPAKPASLWHPQQGVLQRKCACGNHAMAGGECAECAKKKSVLQRKLSVGSSNDPLEQEADRVAGQVLADPSAANVKQAPISIQRYSAQPSESSEEAPASVGKVLAGSGRPMDAPVRSDMEMRFGHDFSQVRVYQGSAAEQSARDVNANAYTVGHNIVFGTGQYMPETQQGRRLVAHELTHVIQQSGTNRGNANLQREEAAAEDAKPRDESLGIFEEGTIDVLAATASAGAPMLKPVIKGGAVGFYTEVRHQVKEGKGDKFIERFKKLLVSPSDMLAYGKGYLWGVLQGLWSPVQGIIDIVKLAWKLQQWQMETLVNVIKNFHEIATMQGSLIDRLSKLGGKAKGFFEGIKNNAVDFISRLMGAISGGVFDLAKSGGHKAGQAIFKFLDKPWGEIGEGIGTVVGTVLIEVIMAAFSGGIGNAVTKVGQVLDKVAPTLMKGVRFIAGELGTIIKEIHIVIETIKAGLAKAGRSILKGMEEFIGDVGGIFDDLIAMLKKLFTGAEEAAVKLPVDVPLPVKAPTPHISAPKPHAPAVKPPHLDSPSVSKAPSETHLSKDSHLETGAPKKSQAEVIPPKEPHAIKNQGDAVKFVEEHPPKEIIGEPGHRRAPVGEGHEIIEMPGGAGCELHSSPPHMGVPCPWKKSNKREPFADDPDFHQDLFDEGGDVLGANKENLGKTTKGVESRSGQGTGLFNADKHHVFPQEERRWFERRGMKGTNNIDNFTVKLEKSSHQAQHGGGDWKLARKEWKGEYNKFVMRELKEAEAAKRFRLGNKRALLSPDEIKEVVYKIMDQRQIPREFVKYK